MTVMRLSQRRVLVAAAVLLNDAAGAANKDSLTKDPGMGNVVHIGRLSKIARPAPLGDVKLYFDSKAFKDVWLAVAWSVPCDVALQERTERPVKAVKAGFAAAV
jgi:hypothetical protein